MKTLLIVMFLDGFGVAVPFVDMDSCLAAERNLAVDEIESSRCEYDHNLVEHDT